MVTHNGTHYKALVHEPVSEVIALKDQEVTIMVDLTTYCSTQHKDRETSELWISIIIIYKHMYTDAEEVGQVSLGH